MTGASLAGISGIATGASSAVKHAAAQDGSFGSLVRESVQQTNGLETKAQTAVMDLLSGGGTEVHSAMIQTQQSELAFELALQVRNKAVSAYQQMMQMQF